MKKSIYLITTILLSLSLSTKVEAYCTQEEIKRFKQIEDQYTVTRSFDDSTQEYIFTYHIVNSEYFDFKVETGSGVNCVFRDIENLECRTKDLSEKQEYIITSNSSSCNEELKKESAVAATEKKEIYNKYSESELCKGIEEFILCQKEYNKEITQEEFESRVETYKNEQKETNKDQQKEPTEDVKETSNDIFKNIIDYINKNIIKISIIIVFITLLIISIILQVKSIKKSRRLE